MEPIIFNCTQCPMVFNEWGKAYIHERDTGHPFKKAGKTLSVNPDDFHCDSVRGVTVDRFEEGKK